MAPPEASKQGALRRPRGGFIWGSNEGRGHVTDDLVWSVLEWDDHLAVPSYSDNIKV